MLPYPGVLETKISRETIWFQDDLQRRGDRETEAGLRMVCRAKGAEKQTEYNVDCRAAGGVR